MPQYYIHVEAVNLAHVVDDTHDISTIRGGSFMLLDAVRQLEVVFKGRLTPISTAASQGVFLIDSPEDLDGLCHEVLAFLRKKVGGHATFLTAIESAEPGPFPLILEKLRAQIRRQQWRMPTVVVPDFESTSQECYLDGWRPGVESYPYRDEQDVDDVKISKATHFRRTHGREIKHTLFHRLLGDEVYKDNLCAKDLGELATDPGKGILNGKIAFIHVDGNSFGKIRNDLCTTPETRGRFDKEIQESCRNAFLKALLERARQNPDYRTHDMYGNEALRIEVLLWGGDEMTIVVPAWLGWDVLALYYDHANKLFFDDVALSHRAALIFCHHNAPILQIRRLAEGLLAQTRVDIKNTLKHQLVADRELAKLPLDEKGKVLKRLANHRHGNAAHYLILESFDMLGGSLKHFLQNYYKIPVTEDEEPDYADDDKGKATTIDEDEKMNYEDLLIYAADFSSLQKNLKVLRLNLPRGAVLDVISALQQEDSTRFSQLVGKIAQSVGPENILSVRNALEALTATNKAGWYLIADLWDYIDQWAEPEGTSS